MNMPTPPRPVSSVPLGSVDDMRQRIRSKSKLKGRQPDDAAVQEVRDLLGTGPHARDLLIEHLHRLQDHFRCLHDRHLVALAKEMRIGMAEVFEVATFYHHFEVLKGDAEPAALTVRVCDGLSCEMAGAQDLLARLPAILGRADVRVIPAPCIGRCEQAPAAVVHQNPVPFATLESVALAVQAHAGVHPLASDTGSFEGSSGSEKAVSPAASAVQVAPAYVGLDAYRAAGACSQRPMHGAGMTRTSARPKIAGKRANKSWAPAISQLKPSHTRTVSAAGSASPLRTSKW